MPTLETPVEIQQGADFRKTFELWLADEVVDDLTNATAVASLTKLGLPSGAVVSLTAGNGRVAITPTRWLEFALAGADTAALAEGMWSFRSTITYTVVDQTYERPGPSFLAHVVPGV